MFVITIMGLVLVWIIFGIITSICSFKIRFIDDSDIEDPLVVSVSVMFWPFIICAIIMKIMGSFVVGILKYFVK
jgi:hypothetical protein